MLRSLVENNNSHHGMHLKLQQHVTDTLEYTGKSQFVSLFLLFFTHLQTLSTLSLSLSLSFNEMGVFFVNTLKFTFRSDKDL